MKPILFSDPQTVKFAKLLGLDRWQAAGVLAGFWEWADLNCNDVSGHDGEFRPTDVQDLYDFLGWSRANGDLIGALLACRMIDTLEHYPGQYLLRSPLFDDFYAYCITPRDRASKGSEAWLQLVEAEEGCCVYCGYPPVKVQREHMIPTSRGGDNSIGNLAPACRECNAKKGVMTPLEFVFGLGPQRGRR